MEKSLRGENVGVNSRVLERKKEQEKIVREGELELRRREMDLKEKRDVEEIRMRRKEI